MEDIIRDETGKVLAYEPHVHVPHRQEMRMQMKLPNGLVLSEQLIRFCIGCGLMYWEEVKNSPIIR